MTINENPTQDNIEQPVVEPAYRKPGVQNFRSLHSDTIDTAKTQKKSVAQIIISANEKKWEERKIGKLEKKIQYENIYERPVYKALLILIIVVVSILFGLKATLTPKESVETTITVPTSTPSNTVSSNSTSSQE